jgi:hypothetical protein
MRVSRSILSFVALLFLAQTVFAKGDAPTAPKVKEMIAKTRKVIVHAASVVKENKGTGKDDLRKAIVHNKAARAALKKQKLGVAAHLTLKARGFARDAIKANKGAKEAPEKDTPAETAAAESADPKEADAEVADADKSTPADATEDKDADSK